MLVVVFVEVMPYRNKENFQQHSFHASSDNSFIPSVLFHNAECAFDLNGAVHPQEGAVDTLEVVDDFLVHGGEFFIQTDGAVLVGLLAFFSIWASLAVLAAIDFFLPSVFVSPDSLPVLKAKGFSVRAAQDAVLVNPEVDNAEGVIAILLVLRLLGVHGELHELFHAVLLAVDVVVVGAVAGVSDGVFREKSVGFVELLH